MFISDLVSDPPLLKLPWKLAAEGRDPPLVLRTEVRL